MRLPVDKDWHRPGVIVRQFMAIWDMPIADLERCAEHARQQYEAETDLLSKLAKKSAISTFADEIARRERVAAKEREDA